MTAPDEAARADALFRQLHALSMEAFELAKATAGDEGDAAQRCRRAQEIEEELTALQPQVAGLAPQHHDRLYRPLTEGRMDLGFVLSGGEDPTTSTRLHYFLEDRAAGQ